MKLIEGKTYRLLDRLKRPYQAVCAMYCEIDGEVFATFDLDKIYPSAIKPVDRITLKLEGDKWIQNDDVFTIPATPEDAS